MIDDECWACNENYVFIKINIDKNSVNKTFTEYISIDSNIRYNKIVNFINRNLIKNNRCFSDSEHFTIGYYMEYPDYKIPFRMRLGGDFKFNF